MSEGYDSRSDARPNLLVLSHRVPYPPHNGAAIRTFGLLKELAGAYELTMLCFDRVDSALERMSASDRLERMRALGRVEAVEIGQQKNRLRFALDHLSSLATGRPYTDFVHRSSRFDAVLGEMLAAHRYVGVHVDTIDLVRYLPRVAQLPLLLTHHNIESQLLRRRAGSAPSPVMASYLRFQANLVESAERKWATAATLNVVTSAADGRELQRLVPRARIEVIPNAVNVEGITPVSRTGNRVVFVGGTNYFPNLEALHWFGGEVLPRMRARGFTGEVDWIGRATPAEQASLGPKYGINLVGYVDDIRPHFERAGCFVAPLLTGGGTRLKILDAWAHGLPVVSTTLGCEGLEGVDATHLLVSDSPDEFGLAVERVLADDQLRDRLGSSGRQLVDIHYSWTVVGARLVAAYTAVLGA